MNEQPRYILNGVCADASGIAYITSSIEQLDEERVDHMVIHQFGPAGRQTVFSAMHATAGMVATPTGVLCVSIDGEVFEFPRDGSSPEFIESQGEHVDTSDEGPNHLLHLKDVRRIGDAIYCAGFARHVYRRGPGRTWSAVDDGVFVPSARITKPIGFLALAGNSEQLFHAAGMAGEIWTCRGGSWAQESSPTNVALTDMAILPSGEVYIVGLEGIILRGSPGRWEVLEQTVTKKSFWGVAYFAGRVYVSTNDGVFVVSDDGRDLACVHAGGLRGTAYLDASESRMWSVGDKAIAWTDDGQTWTSLPLP